MDESFSFMLHNQKEVTLSKHKKLISSNIFRRFLKSENEYHGQWYYVHFTSNVNTEIRKYMSLKVSDELIKSTFVLFLYPDQIEKISNVSLIRPVEPKEKFNEDGGPLKQTDKLIIYTAPNFEIPRANEDYLIENKKNDNSIIIRFVQSDLSEHKFLNKKRRVIRLLSEIPEVKSISTYSNLIPNNAIISGFTQKNSYDFKLHSSSKFYYLDRYLNNYGITGINQTISILDTPIDFYHAMLRDDNVQVKLNTYLPNHRKIIYYNFNGSLNNLLNTIEENEHGTHVAGTAAGKSICTNDLKQGTKYFNGNAPDSKILYAGDFNLVGAQELSKLMNKYNSQISSNSWSTTAPFNPENYEYGKIAEMNPNLIFIFAAGNDYGNFGNFTVFDPSSSKNILTIGSISDFYINNDLYTIKSKNDKNVSFIALGFKMKDIWFSASIGAEPGKSDILAINLDQGQQCQLLDQNSVFLFYGQDLDWLSSCNNSASGSSFLYASDIEQIEKLLESKSDIIVSKNVEINQTKRISQSYYSSTGPGNKGILKPDVMAPGTKVFSAKSKMHSNSPHGCSEGNEDSFAMMSGTSMATPNVAGAAALIHQYFESGKWIDKVTLDGPTTRALLINSARHPSQSKTPDITFGHGVVDLSTILPINNDFGVQITHLNNLTVLDQIPFVTENGHVISNLTVNKKLSKNDLQITLSYLDVMLNMDSPIPITRDLDLIVISPSKKIFLGDHLANGDSQHLSTNEKVIIRNNELEDGVYTIHVYAGNFADSDVLENSQKQEFSVVASGPIKNGYIEFSESFECPCDECDPKHPGFCLCNEETEIGPICQAKIETFHGIESAFYVGPLEIKRVKFVSPKKINYIFSKSRNPGRQSTIWVSTSCHYTLGEYEVNGLTNNESSASAGEETKVNFGTNEVCVAIFNNNYEPAIYILDVSDNSKYKWFRIIFWSLTSLVFVLIVALIVLIVFKTKCCSCCNCCACCTCCANCELFSCPKCCKCFQKNENTEATADTLSQFHFNDKLINYP